MKLICVRHGQTDYNKKKIPQGQEIDAPLNSDGIKQVEIVLKFIPNDIDVILASPLKRAAQTAEILNRELSKEIIYSQNLREISYGSLAGRSWQEIDQVTQYRDVKAKDDNILFDYTEFGGESAEQFKERIRVFIEDTKERFSGKTILVATHGGVIDALHVLFPQKEKAETNNATIHEFVF